MSYFFAFSGQDVAIYNNKCTQDVSSKHQSSNLLPLCGYLCSYNILHFYGIADLYNLAEYNFLKKTNKEDFVIYTFIR